MLQKLLYYLNPLTLFQKKEKGSVNASHKTMQLINRVSIYLFLTCIVLIVLKYLKA